MTHSGKEYLIIFKEDLVDLTATVNDCAADGWELVDSRINTTTRGDYAVVMQKEKVDTFTCDECGKTFTKSRTDAEALCDNCFRKITGKNPERS